MTEIPAIIEIEKRDGEYRIELRERETGTSIESRTLDGADDGRAYKHVCKVRLPAEGEATIDLDRVEDRIVLRAEDRTCYRHRLPTPVSAAH
ncbi:hypothetical protein [Halalkalicoccus sp. NIPERK01]|uniref:hypothetical protein n=1 Tax=Halalkalicoccus sp. NIPERK01 TaxID=3053469 RepID=UPI00256EB48A|nr:hypothetical protein [Halalkalicoccus sp. NIPERK01]MDL5361468.1 hypothetical protein [Halalkalicoccus sp. NIPERK01]